MNLDSYNVAELNHNEVVDTNGGIFPILIVCGAVTYEISVAWAAAFFFAGVGVGAAVAQGQQK